MRKKIWVLWLCAGLCMTGLTGIQAGASEQNSGQVADASEMAEVENVVEDWMVPIPPSALVDGVYDVKVNCSSSMFPIESAVLLVQDGSMQAVLTMGGTGYAFVYPGSGEEASQAEETALIPFEEDVQGRHTFTIPVAGLDQAVPLAAFSKRKEKWYDRSLAFVSTSLPAEAFAEGRPMVTAQELGLEDGEYLVETELSGGSGRASIDSPARLWVENGRLTLEVIFGSKNYDYMLVDGERFEPENTEGNSTFLIPAAGFDAWLPVTADTVAMSKPHEIDYTIMLDSASLQAK